MNKGRPYQQYNSALDAAFDIRRESALTVQNNQVIQRHGSAIKKLHQELQQAYEYADTLDNNLRTELMTVLQPMHDSIAQLEADMRIDPEYPDLTIVGVLTAHEQRLNKLEQMIGGPYAQSGAQFSTHDTTAYDSDTTTRHDIGMSDASAHRPQLRAKRATPQHKFASDIKRREVREYYAQYYPRQNQHQIADHFGISVRTLQRYLEEE